MGKPSPANGDPPLQSKNGHVEVLEQPAHNGLHNGLHIDPPPVNPAPTHNAGPERPAQPSHPGNPPLQYFVPDNPTHGQRIPAPPQTEAGGRPYYALSPTYPPYNPEPLPLPRLPELVHSEQSPASYPREMTRPTNQCAPYPQRGGPPLHYQPQSRPDDAPLPHPTASHLPSTT